MDWSFTAPSAVSVPCKSNYILMFPSLKIVQNEGKHRNSTSLVVRAQSKWRYGVDVSNWSFHEEMSGKLPWQTVALGRWRGGWNGSRGCIRGRRIRFRVVDVWRNLRRISSDITWHKVGCIMCQNQVRMFSLSITHQTTCRPRPRNVSLQTVYCCCNNLLNNT